MPWKLLGFILFLIIFIIFAGFNTQRVTVNMGPLSFTDVPLFIAISLSFIAGVLVTLPLTMISIAKSKKKSKPGDKLTSKAKSKKDKSGEADPLRIRDES